jgi:large exoprotein involved in heme utilization and adhesion
VDLSRQSVNCVKAVGEFVPACTSTFGAAKGGSLIVNASQGVQLIGTGTFAVGQIGSNLSAIASGTGDAGDIAITTPTLLIGDGASVSTGTVGAGKGGNLTITTGQLLVRDGAFVSADTAGVGKGGNVIVNASQGVQVLGRSADNKLGSYISANTAGTSDAGNLTITTPVLLVRDGARISVSTLGAGKGGSLIINASDSVQLVGGSLSAFTTGTGDGGEIRITTGQLLVRDGASIDADTLAAGKGGSLVVHASDWVQLVGGDLSAFTAGTGDGGEIRITTGQLLLKDGAEIFVGTLGAGKGGSVTIDASDWVRVIGESADGRSNSNLSATTAGTGNGGEIRITTGQLLVRDGAGIFAATVGAGKGGNLTVNASDSVQVIGESADGRFNSKLTTQAEETGDAGNLTITTSELLIRDGAQVDASTFGAGKGGRLIVNASDSVQVIGGSAADSKFGSSLGTQTEGTGDAGDMSITTARLLISDGAFVSAGTGGAGKGGDLTVNASESVQVIGTSADGEFPSLLSVRARATSGSTAGNLTVQTRQMSVRDGAEVTVSSPSGQAGNMTITANSLHLNQGKLTAVTGTSGAEGGANITLQGLDLLRMDNESLISASALEDANGGNVTINSTFIVATPPKGPEGSDITANAVRGNGGRVSITTQGLFGIEFRPQRTPKNDITVSSQFGLTGVFEQNTPGVDPSRGLAELPTEVVDVTNLIDRRCTSGTAQQSSFTITGRGGLPPSPNDTLQNDSVMVDWVTLDPSSENRSRNDTSATPTAPQTPTLTEAQGWVYGPNGEVILTAQAPNVTPHSPALTPATCSSQ